MQRQFLFGEMLSPTVHLQLHGTSVSEHTQSEVPTLLNWMISFMVRGGDNIRKAAQEPPRALLRQSFANYALEKLECFRPRPPRPLLARCAALERAVRRLTPHLSRAALHTQ